MNDMDKLVITSLGPSQVDMSKTTPPARIDEDYNPSSKESVKERTSNNYYQYEFNFFLNPKGAVFTANERIKKWLARNE